jgi:transcriptional antiterminator NusG
MAKNWYVIHTYSGYENKVKVNIGKRFQVMGMQDKLGQILIPSEQVVEIKEGKKKVSARKFYPGYILVEMEMSDETWYLVRTTPKVTGFVGSGNHPIPLSEREIKNIMSQIAGEEKVVKPKPKVMFETGETVKIISGPFSNFSGMIEEVNPDKGRLRVKVAIFGRATPVELDFLQVERA